MNKERRKALDKIQDQLTKKGEELNAFLSAWHEEITGLRDELETLKDEEEQYRDDMPENLQGSERYSTADDAVNALEEALSELGEKLDSFEEAAQDDNVLSGVFDHIEEAKGQS